MGVVLFCISNWPPVSPLPLIQDLHVLVFSRESFTTHYCTYSINSKPPHVIVESSLIWPQLTFLALCITEDPGTRVTLVTETQPDFAYTHKGIY